MDWYNNENEEINPTDSTETKEKPNMFIPSARKNSNTKTFTGKQITSLVLGCTILGSSLGLGGALLGNKLSDSSDSTTINKTQSESRVVNVNYVNSGEELTAAQVYAANVNATVGITTSVTTNYFGYQTTAAASGSGFIISSDGYILTNYHVVEDSTSIKVSTYSGETYSAELVGYDEGNDVAVLKIDATGLTPVTIGDSDNLNVGDNVMAIGNPLGELTFSLTTGVVSAMNRTVTLSSDVTLNLIQTDTAINSGNSGGALFNMYGEVIGITTAKYSSSGSSASVDNIGFAIPINSAMNIAQSIIEKGYISKSYIGVSVKSVSTDATSYGVPAGIYIGSVSENGPAQKAGIESGDIVTAINGENITDTTSFVNTIQGMDVGTTVKLTVYRNGDYLEVEVVTEEYQQSALPQQTEEQSNNQAQSYNSEMGGNGMNGYNGFSMPFGY